jgi:N6-adenosine-specific RNA methylase IME4
VDSLLVLNECRDALAEAKTLGDVLKLADKAEIVRQAMKRSGASVEAINQAVEFKANCDRVAGEAVKAMEKSKGGRPTKTGSREEPVSLADIGLSKKQSHRLQTVASIPPKKFAAIFAEANEQQTELSTTAVYRVGRELARTKPEPVVHVEPVSGIIADLSEVAGQKFGTIYADPPWAYDNKATRANVDSIYAGTMTVDEICDMPVADLAADDSHLHLWTTNAFLHDAFHVMLAWGFEYRSAFVWVKPQMGIGNYWRVSHEYLLLGIRGNAKRFNEHGHKSWGEYDRTEHSAKPEQIRHIIERCSPGPCLELFGRQSVEGWTVFGNQVERRLIPA